MTTKLKAQTPFLYQSVYQTLNEQIKSGALPPGSRLPSEADLARSFSVHTLTVRRALRMLQKSGLVQRQHGSGTFVGGNSKCPPAILYVGETETHFNRDLYLALSRLARDRAQTLSTFEMVSPDEAPTPGLAEALAGVPVVIVQSDYCARVAPLLSSKHRLVVVGDEKPELDRPVQCVLIDRRAAIDLAVDHLVALGHRRIALVLSTDWVLPLPPRLHEEYAAYAGAMASHGIRDYDQTVRLRTRPEFQAENLARLRKLLAPASKAPTAFICPTDYRAHPLYLAAAEMDLKIPRDFSVIGMLDTPWCTGWIPQLTSVNCGIDDMARLAMMLGSEAFSRSMVCRVGPRLVVRQSTVRPRAPNRSRSS